MRFALHLQNSKRYANADIPRKVNRNWRFDVIGPNRRRRRSANLRHRRETVSQRQDDQPKCGERPRRLSKPISIIALPAVSLRETVSQHLRRFGLPLPGFLTAMRESKWPLCPTAERR
jgi:hypothetical protein